MIELKNEIKEFTYSHSKKITENWFDELEQNDLSKAEL